MTKAEVINAIVAETGISRAEATASVEAFMAIIKKAMTEGKESVYLRGFGTFVIKHRAEKLARNISKNTSVLIPAHDYPTFKPAKTFVEQMNK
ncbi:MAG: integration host factor subunit beta [Bacteroidaceae bacterium]|nr:integration host factor subunit beta [Bacteroidaceae bacterium]